MINSWSYKEEYKLLRKKILNKIDHVFKSNVLLFGKELSALEKKFSKKYKANYAIGVSSGTHALELSLRALDLNRNDEIILPANSAIPTVSAVVNAGLIPKFADIKNDYLINPNKIEPLINKNTKIIMPVHLYGQSCDMEKIIKIAKKYKLKIIEDCAQAQGAKYKNKFVGTFGLFGCFSFYPTKILGSYGDAGMILTNNKKFYEKIMKLRFYGIEKSNKKNIWYNKYYSNINGTNSRLSEVQAGILNIKFPYLENWIKKRRNIADYYNKKIINKDVTKPKLNSKNYHVYHLYVISHPNRNLLIKKMRKKGIKIDIHYPYPLHKMKAYSKNACKNCTCLRMVEKKSKEILSLPIYPFIKNKDLDKIIKIINSS